MSKAAEIRRAFGLDAASDGLLFVKPADAVQSERLRGQAHYIRRAFDRLRLDGVICIDGVPTIYLKEFQRPVGRQEVNELHRRFWNEGTGTLLLILDPAHLYVFSSMKLPSKQEGEITSHEGLVEQLDRTARTLKQYKLITRVASGQYYREHAPKFRPAETVDRHLLDNLAAVGDRLRRDESVAERKRVHAFLGRIVFTCYLIDRRVIELSKYPFIRKQSVNSLLELLEAYEPDRARMLLHRLFDQLRDDFNGSMFDAEPTEQQATISEDDTTTLIRFLRGEQIESGQMALGFWAYDFAAIPVETISAIYEKFLEEEDASDRERQGAFYTPKHLAEMVVDEATAHLDSLIDKRCLDPACGSGIFLVILFNRIAEEIERRNPRIHSKTRFNELLDVLETQICGVDVNKTACRIACFSLYIALLDQFDPRELNELQAKSGKRLPNLLAYKDDAYHNASTIYEGNYFDPKLPIHDEFDIVVGNPPWVGRNQSADADVVAWAENEDANPFLADAPRAKARRTALFLPQKQIAHAFMWKAALSVNETGHVCLLLPVQVLLNETDAFQHAWFATMNVHRVFNLSDFRLFLFQDAKRPATIIHFGYPKTVAPEHRIEHVAPKVRRQDPRSGLIKVFADDHKWLAGEDVIEASRPQSDSERDQLTGAAVFWKSLLWGTPRDVDFVEYLRRLDSLGAIAGEPDEEKQWIKGEGFKPWYQISFESAPATYGAPKPIPGRLDDRFIKTVDATQMFCLRPDTTTLRDRLQRLRCRGYSKDTPDALVRASLDGFHRSPSAQLYEPPLVLINDGFNKFSFVDFFTFYQHALTGIHGPPEDEHLLRFFAVYAKTRLAKYFIFHTASSLGTERDRVLVHELMRLPFPLPDSPDTHKDAAAIVEEVATRMKELQAEIAAEYMKLANADDFDLQSQTLAESRRQRVERLQSELEPLVYRYFKLTTNEISLIEDTCDVLCASATPADADKPIPATQLTSERERLQYADLLCKTLNKWANADQPRGAKPPFYFSAEVAVFSDTELVLATLRQVDEPARASRVQANGQLEKVFGRIAAGASYERGSFEYLRGVIVANGRMIHILKPDMLAQWTRTAALNDADRVFHAIVQSKRK